MADPTKAEVRNPTYGGETAQESVDRMTGGVIDRSRSHPSAVSSLPPKAPGPSIHPTAKGVYGAPIGTPILK